MAAQAQAAQVAARQFDNLLNNISEYHYEDDAIIAFWNDWKGRDGRAMTERTFMYGRFSYKKRTAGRGNGKWFCCLKHAAAQARGLLDATQGCIGGFDGVAVANWQYGTAFTGQLEHDPHNAYSWKAVVRDGSRVGLDLVGWMQAHSQKLRYDHGLPPNVTLYVQHRHDDAYSWKIHWRA